jgi:hypothetical protein
MHFVGVYINDRTLGAGTCVKFHAHDWTVPFSRCVTFDEEGAEKSDPRGGRREAIELVLTDRLGKFADSYGTPTVLYARVVLPEENSQTAPVCTSMRMPVFVHVFVPKGGLKRQSTGR